MNEQEAKALFRQAADVYKDGDHKDALKIFDRLNAAFPNNERIMFPRARCFAKLGRTDEAVAICDQLIAQFGHQSALELRGKLVSGEFQAIAVPGLTEDTAFDPLDLNVDEKLPSAFERVQVQKTSRNISPKLIIAIAVGAALLLLGLPLLFGGGGAAEDSVAVEDGEYTEPPAAPPPAMLPGQGDTQ